MNAAVSAGWVLMLSGMGGLFWATFVDEPRAFDTQKLISASVDNGGAPTLVLEREICAPREIEATSFRIYRRVAADGRSEESTETPTISMYLAAGCTTSIRRITPPPTLRAGTWVLSTGIRACNGGGKCATQYLDPPISITIDGDPPKLVAVAKP